ncbi:MAG TPA: hypothetical protein PLR28_05505 [Dokdonella sp.]|nr:hypothetical protein [Dokdonella sp.]
MRTRLIIADANGTPLMATDSGHEDGHADRFIAQNLANLAAQGIAAVVVEFDPDTSGTDALHDLGNLCEVQVEMRTTPSGAREIVGVHRRSRAGARTIARAVRVIHAPDDVITPRTKLHRRARSPKP